MIRDYFRKRRVRTRDLSFCCYVGKFHTTEPTCVTLRMCLQYVCLVYVHSITVTVSLCPRPLLFVHITITVQIQRQSTETEKKIHHLLYNTQCTIDHHVQYDVGVANKLESRYRPTAGGGLDWTGTSS